VVRGVPAEACVTCDEDWFDEETGFALSRILEEHAPAAARTVRSRRRHRSAHRRRRVAATHVVTIL
jgi:hypothetical protein